LSTFIENEFKNLEIKRADFEDAKQSRKFKIADKIKKE